MIRYVSAVLCMLSIGRPLPVAAQRQIGEANLLGGLSVSGWGLSVGTGPAVAGSLAFLLGPVSAGPEAGYYHFARGGHVTTLGGVVRLRVVRRPAEIYLTGGLARGAYRGPVTANLLSYSAGAGAAWSAPGSPWGILLEGRWMGSLQATGGAGHPELLSLMAGGRLRW